LINNRSIQANFLRDNPATLPDKYHYGQLWEQQNERKHAKF
jgi:hypothetical protein